MRQNTSLAGAACWGATVVCCAVVGNRPVLAKPIAQFKPVAGTMSRGRGIRHPLSGQQLHSVIMTDHPAQLSVTVNSVIGRIP